MKKSIIAVLAGILLLANFAIAQQAVVPSVSSTSNRVATYRAAISGITVASSATDIFRLSGSATRTIYVKNICIGGVKTTSGSLRVLLYKRSTANADGTTVAITEHPLDSTSGAATAVAVGYTANSTVGTGVLIGAKRTAWLSDTAAANVEPTCWNFADWGPNQFLVLRGVAQGVTLHLDSTTQTGGVASVEAEWMEQ